MEKQKLTLIQKILEDNIAFASEQIAIIFEKIREVETMSDEEFSENADPILGRETKEAIMKSLQYQFGYLAARQSENTKFMNMLNSDLEGLELLSKTRDEFNNMIKNDIQKSIDDIPTK